MTIIFFLALLVYILVCAVLVALIMMQEGKGGGLSGVMGASMGETFGFGGASKQIRKYTAVCASIFLVLTIVLTFLAEGTFRSGSKFVGNTVGSSAPTAPSTATPAAPAGDAPTASQPGTPGAPNAVTPAGESNSITITPAAGTPAAAPDAAPAVTPAP